ncbi:MAG: 4Fe-4S binding protein [Planctomycetia bacterium]|nr:4Fe-4S binding protein [Planctomycetia bacterium]
MLRILRRLMAICIFGSLTFFFLDAAEILPACVSYLAKIQLVPAFLAHRWIIVVFLVFMTFFLGRFYCSTICPLGILQDIIARAGRFFSRKRKYTFSPAKNRLRWAVVLMTGIFIACGFSLALTLLDPYSIFGRTATNVFRPVYLSVNNLLSYFDTQSRVFPYVNPAVLSLEAFFFAFFVLLGIGILAYRNGRTYCNTICPLGTILGFLARFSLFKIRLAHDKCIGCGKCARQCKSSCIDIQQKKVDASRCVTCFNCLGICPTDALNFSLFSSGTKHSETHPDTDSRSSVTENTPCPPDGMSKRAFLVTLTAVLGAVKKGFSQPLEIFQTGKHPFTRSTPVAPPGAVSITHLKEHCTACHLCVSKCPVQILKPAFMEYGLDGAFMPHMEFSRGFCTYDCTLCGEVCPNGAILPLTQEEKHRTQVGHVVFLEKNCVVTVDGKNCGACAEHCPTQAVTMVPYKDSLTIPKIDPEICVGCGGCESICPVRPYKAIYVEGNQEHLRRKEFEDQKVEIEIDDFGF